MLVFKAPAAVIKIENSISKKIGRKAYDLGLASNSNSLGQHTRLFRVYIPKYIINTSLFAICVPQYFVIYATRISGFYLPVLVIPFLEWNEKSVNWNVGSGSPCSADKRK